MEVDGGEKGSGDQGRCRDPTWNLFTVTQVRGRKPSTAFCKICEKSVSPKIERLRVHLERYHSGVDVSRLGLDAESSQYESNVNLDGNGIRYEMKTESLLNTTADQASSSSESDSNETLPEINFVVMHGTKLPQKHEIKDTQAEMGAMQSDSIDLGIPEERDLILKYFSLTESEAEIKCNLCDDRMSPKTTKLIDHLFDFHTATIDTISKELGLEEIDSQDSRHSEVATSSFNGPTRRSRMSVWNHFDKVVVEYEDNKILPKVKCKLCQQIVSRKVERLRRHMLYQHPDSVDKETEERFLSSKEAQGISTRKRKRRNQEEKNQKVDIINLKSVKPEIKREGKRSVLWAHFEATLTPNTAKGLAATCKICHRNVSPKIERLRRHFVSFHPDIVVTEGTSLETDLEEPPFGPAIAEKPGGSRNWIWKYFDLRQEDETSSNRRQAQCRLCLEFHDSDPDPLYQHLRNSHPGILEFSDTDNGNSDDDACHIEIPKRKKRRKLGNSKSSGKCLLCEHEVTISSSASLVQSWDVNCAKSLCEVFHLPESYCQYFKTGKYCNSCQELVRNIDFTQRALKRLSTLLASYRITYENLLRKQYSRQMADSHSSGSGNGILAKLHLAIVKMDVNACGTKMEIFQEPKNNERLTGRRFLVTDEPLAQKTRTVIENTSKCGRTSSRNSFLESDNDGDIGSRRQIEDVIEEHKRIKSTAPGVVSNILSSDSCLPEETIRNEHKLGGRLQDEDTILKTTTGPNARKKLICKEPGCNFSCYWRTRLDAHYRSRHENDVTPYHSECGKKFPTMTRYAYHLRGHHGSKLHHHSHSDKTFPGKRKLRSEVHLKIPPELTKCPFCCLLLVGGSQPLTEHEKLHEANMAKGFPYGCVLCHRESQVFTNSVDLKSHVKQIHNHSSIDLKCEKCEKIFKTKRILRRHSHLAHSEDALANECGECGTLSENRAEHLIHLRQHATGRPYLCAECGTTFKTKSNLRVHTMLHTGEKPWRCKLCPKGFNQTSKLKAHEETHVPTKNYVCDKCGKSFRTARNIYQHQRFHCHPESVNHPKSGQRRKNYEVQEEPGNSNTSAEEGQGQPHHGHSVGHVHQSHDEIRFPSSSDNNLPVWIHEEQEFATLGLVEND